MKNSVVKYLFLCSFILVLSGCGRIVDWAEGKFYQGTDIRGYSKVPRSYIRSVKVYDQFTTLASFDALWLADPVRISYANLYAFKHGREESLRKAFLRRQLEENRHYISFYILTNYGLSFGEQMSDWSVFLDTGVHVMPSEIKIVDLSPEYKAFLGKKLNVFKTVYLVKFNAKNNDGNPIILNSTTDIKLVFRSVKKEIVLSWPITTTPLIIEQDGDEDCTGC